MRSIFDTLDGIDELTDKLDDVVKDLDKLDALLPQLLEQFPPMIAIVEYARTMILTMHSTMSGILNAVDETSENATAMGQAFDAAKNDDSFYLPPEVFQNADFQRAMNSFLSPDGKAARFIISHKGDPATPEGIARIDQIRTAAEEALKTTPLEDAKIYIAGTASTFKDFHDGAKYDLYIAGVGALCLIFIIMLVITRSFVAALVIVGTVALSLGASFGLSVLVWQYILGIKLHWMVLPMSVIVLLAVGSDYNLLLVSRMKEEIAGGINTGIIRAMGGTGKVVTNAGLVFAFTMASMVASDLRIIGQVGTTIGLGLMFDTLVVRSFMTPSIAALLGTLVLVAADSSSTPGQLYASVSTTASGGAGAAWREVRRRRRHGHGHRPSLPRPFSWPPPACSSHLAVARGNAVNPRRLPARRTAPRIRSPVGSRVCAPSRPPCESAHKCRRTPRDRSSPTVLGAGCAPARRPPARRVGPAERTTEPDMAEAGHHVRDGQAVVTQVECQRHEQVSVRPQAPPSRQAGDELPGQEPDAVDLAAVGDRAVHPRQRAGSHYPVGCRHLGVQHRNITLDSGDHAREVHGPESTGQLVGHLVRHIVEDRIGDDALRHDDLGDPRRRAGRRAAQVQPVGVQWLGELFADQRSHAFAGNRATEAGHQPAEGQRVIRRLAQQPPRRRRSQPFFHPTWSSKSSWRAPRRPDSGVCLITSRTVRLALPLAAKSGHTRQPARRSRSAPGRRDGG